MHDLIGTLAAGEIGLGPETALVRPVAMRGVGARTDGEAIAVTPAGDQVGRLLEGTLATPIADAVGELLASADTSRLVTLTLADGDAVRAGLACGGTVDLLLQRATALPEVALRRLAAGEPLALATDLAGGTCTVLEPAGGRPGPAGAAGDPAATAGRLVRAGRTGAAVTGDTVVELFLPTTRMLVVGGGLLAEALRAQAGLLGWQVTCTSDPDEAVAALPGLGPAACVVLLAHDPAIDDPVLRAALDRPTPYIGALGSRRTQAGRAERMGAAGYGNEQLARIHGPVGLAIGARTPPETAVAICAEALAVLTGREPRPLRDSPGPIHP
jgi:xanthine dehydrogenase accessory factor